MNIFSSNKFFEENNIFQENDEKKIWSGGHNHFLGDGGSLFVGNVVLNIFYLSTFFLKKKKTILSKITATKNFWVV